MKQFNPQILKGVKESPCDIFAELPSGKMIKICEAGNLINRELIDKCLNDDTTKTFMTDEGLSKFVKAKVDSRLHAKIKELDDPQYKDRGKRLGIQENTIKIARAYVKNFGMSDEILELADKTVDAALYTIEKSPNLKLLITDLLKKGEFFEKKSLLICYLSLFALSKMTTLSEQQRETIAMAAFLHDFTLDSEACLMVDQTDENLRKLERGLVANFESHIKTEASLLRESGNVKDEVISLILNHHIPLNADIDVFGKEVPKLPVMSQIFNIAHDLAIQIIKGGTTKHSYADFYYDLSHQVLPRYHKSVSPFSYLL